MPTHNDVMVRPSKFLSLKLTEGRYIAQNPLVGQQRLLPLPIVTLLASIDSPTLVTRVCDDIRSLFPLATDFERAVTHLVEAGILVEQNSELDRQERIFEDWVWAPEAAAHFLATRRVRWMAEESEVEAFGKLLQSKSLPALWDDLDDDESWHPFSVDLHARKTFEVFGKRRSLRQFGAEDIAFEALGAILSSGLGVQQLLSLRFRPTYPLKFAPSPGALNVFSGYVFSKNVGDLEPGIYAYNGLRNQARRIADLPHQSLSGLFGNQSWADEAAAICLLCADYRKMSWKYNDQSAFNSLLIESGHIAQNMMVCAAGLSIGSVPTNALNQAEIESHLGLTFPHQAVLYAIAFGHEDPHRGRDHYSPAALSRLAEIIDNGSSPFATTTTSRLV